MCTLAIEKNSDIENRSYNNRKLLQTVKVFLRRELQHSKSRKTAEFQRTDLLRNRWVESDVS